MFVFGNGQGSLRLVLALGVLVCSAPLAQPARAASQDDCAILLCLPAGFASSACNRARRAYLQRLEKGRHPAPSLSECTVDATDLGPQLAAEQERAAAREKASRAPPPTSPPLQ